MNFYILKWSPKVLKYILVLGALLYLIVYLVLAFYRIRYPFELEWMEGGAVDHVRRILAGQKLYVRPSLEFVPYTYTPLFFYLSALVSKIVGIGFIPLRLVSFISSAGCFSVIFLIVYRETKSKFFGLLSSGLFAATFVITSSWFDLARVDSLFLFLILAGIYILRFGTSWQSYIIAGLFVWLSFLTKQTALIIAFPLMVYCVFVNWRRAIFFISVIVLGVIGSTILLNRLHEGWYSFYIFQLPQPFHIERIKKEVILYFWTRDLLINLPIASLMSAFYLLAFSLNTSKKHDLFYLFTAAGMIGGAWVTRMHLGAVENVLLPAYAMLSILFGLGMDKVFEFAQFELEDQRAKMAVYVYLACIIQFALLLYNPRDEIPRQQDLQAGQRFIRLIDEIQGDIFVPNHGYLPALAGKDIQAHGMAVYDVLRGSEEHTKAELIEEINSAIGEKRFSAIILDNSDFVSNYLRPEVEKYYETKQHIFSSETVFWPITGMITRPENIYMPKENETEE